MRMLIALRLWQIDPHEAGRWRNRRLEHPVIVAYAKGKVSGGNTLKHFSGPTSRELAVTLLGWAETQKTYTQTPAHRRLLNDIGSMVTKDDTFSFEQIRAYLEAWSGLSGQNAPRDALPSLGLLPDPGLFADIALVRERLEQNVSMIATLRDKSAGQMEAIRKRLNAARDKALLKIFVPELQK